MRHQDLIEQAVAIFVERTEELHGVVIDLSDIDYPLLKRTLNEELMFEEGGNYVDAVVDFLTDAEEADEVDQFGIYVGWGVDA